MKTYTLTEAKQNLRGILQGAPQEPVSVTVHGKPAATLRILAQPAVSREQAIAAAERIAKLCANIAPSPRSGATAAVRRLRDRGE